MIEKINSSIAKYLDGTPHQADVNANAPEKPKMIPNDVYQQIISIVDSLSGPINPPSKAIDIKSSMQPRETARVALNILSLLLAELLRSVDVGWEDIMIGDD